MWKIFIEYSDKSKCTLTGKQPDISLELALKYEKQYVKGAICKSTYQRYPKNKYISMTLREKINELVGGDNDPL